MMKQTKRFLIMVLTLVFFISSMFTVSTSAASKKVKLNKTKATIYVGKTVKLKVKNNKKKVKWKSSNKKVATVSKKGKVKGKKAGKATITAKVGKKKYKCKITVKRRPVSKKVHKNEEQATIKREEQTTIRREEQTTAKQEEQTTEKPEDGNRDWDYEITDSGVAILRYLGQDTDVIIPNEIQGNSVTEIGNGAFYGRLDLTRITIPESVVSIGEDAFNGCRFQKDNFINNTALNAEEEGYWGAFIYDEIANGLYIKDDTVIGVADVELTEIIIPEGVVSIGKKAFSDCLNLTRITIPESVVSIKKTAFKGCSFRKENFINNSGLDAEAANYWGAIIYNEISNGLYIKDNTVLGVADVELTEIIIPEGVLAIEKKAFSDCLHLTRITIPESVVSIAATAFKGCSFQTDNFINNSELDAEAAKYWGAVIYDEIANGLYIKDNTVIGMADEELTEIIIPEGVVSIGKNAFADCMNLTSVTISEGVETIENSAFSDCSNLTQITMPEGLLSIKNFAFSGCLKLTGITIPKSVVSIKKKAFDECCFQKDNFINNSELDAEAANYWGAVIYDEIINGLYIEDNTVIGVVDEALESTEIIIPEGVLSIANYVFVDCSNLTRITIPKSVVSIKKLAFDNCSFQTKNFINNSELDAEAANYWGAFVYDELTNGLYIKDNTVLCVAEEALESTEIIIPEGVLTIGENAFSGCSDLIRVTIPEGVETIENDAFGDYLKLTGITIPESVVFIGEDAFSGCRFPKENFINNSELDAEAANYWGAIVYDKIVNGLYIRDDTVLGVADEELTEIVIPEGIVSIEEDAFEGCYCQKEQFINNSELDAEAENYWGAVIYDEIINGLYIKDNAVIGVADEELTEIVIPEGVVSIEANAFSEFYDLEYITIPESVIFIDEDVFYDCDSLICIKGKAGSYAETWAEQNGYTFVAE